MTNGSLPIERCKTCGECCKRMGCHYSPDDFEQISVDTLKAEIDKGNISIDWWEGDYEDCREYFLRVRNLDADVIDPSWGGQCMLLTANGCPLDFEHRPKGARFLHAKQSGGCGLEYTKYDCKEDWHKYSDILAELVCIYEEADTSE